MHDEHVSDSLEATWQEVHVLIEEIENLSKSECPPRDFYSKLLDRTTRALGASGGIVWTLTYDGRFQPEHHLNANQLDIPHDEPLRSFHSRLLEDVRVTGAPVSAAPKSGHAVDNAGANTTEFQLLFHPLKMDDRLVAILETWKKAGDDPAVQRAQSQVLAAIAELTADYHRKQALAELRERERRWQNAEHFAKRVHAQLGFVETIAEIVNEGRRITECDRVSIATMEAASATICGVSGAAEVDRRANVIRRLEQLIEVVVQNGEGLWYGVEPTELPPQIQSRLAEYIDINPARAVVILPLTTPSANAARETATVEGVLVLEKFDAVLPTDFQARVKLVADHAALALHNANDYRSLPMLGFMRLLRGNSWFAKSRRLPKVLLALLVLAAVSVALIVIPADFTIEAPGKMEPRETRDVFALNDADVNEVHVKHDEQVDQGAVLISLRSAPLELEFRRILGERDTTNEKLLAVESARITDSGRDSKQARPLAGTEEELRKQLASLESQLEILRHERDALQLRSPIRGTVLTWDANELLRSRPVKRGQVLLSVAREDGPWQVRLQTPDHTIGHVLNAQQNAGGPLPVTFVMATEPGIHYTGSVRQISHITDVDPTGKPFVEALVDFERGKATNVRPGASVLAKIHCGRRPLGYVWLREAIEFIQTKILF